ncbi:hypothetical protein [Brevibacterium litoralis]|uniref:hypothetical protein n=1 Tax=Brevibacterium litoralis TaxID=3138935 RepID=UPI0032EB0433
MPTYVLDSDGRLDLPAGQVSLTCQPMPAQARVVALDDGGHEIPEVVQQLPSGTVVLRGVPQRLRLGVVSTGGAFPAGSVLRLGIRVNAGLGRAPDDVTVAEEIDLSGETRHGLLVVDTVPAGASGPGSGEKVRLEADWVDAGEGPGAGSSLDLPPLAREARTRAVAALGSDRERGVGGGVHLLVDASASAAALPDTAITGLVDVFSGIASAMAETLTVSLVDTRVHPVSAEDPQELAAAVLAARRAHPSTSRFDPAAVRDGLSARAAGAGSPAPRSTGPLFVYALTDRGIADPRSSVGDVEPTRVWPVVLVPAQGVHELDAATCTPVDAWRPGGVPGLVEPTATAELDSLVTGLLQPARALLTEGASR